VVSATSSAVFYLPNQHDEPLSIDAIVDAILAGTLSREALVAPEMWLEPPGESGWIRAGEIPEVRSRLRERELRVVDGAYKSSPRGAVEFGESVMMVVPSSSSKK